MRKSKHNAAPSNRLCEKQLPGALKKVLSAQSALQSPSEAHKNFLDLGREVLRLLKEPMRGSWMSLC